MNSATALDINKRVQELVAAGFKGYLKVRLDERGVTVIEQPHGKSWDHAELMRSATLIEPTRPQHSKPQEVLDAEEKAAAAESAYQHSHDVYMLAIAEVEQIKRHVLRQVKPGDPLVMKDGHATYTNRELEEAEAAVGTAAQDRQAKDVALVRARVSLTEATRHWQRECRAAEQIAEEKQKAALLASQAKQQPVGVLQRLAAKLKIA